METLDFSFSNAHATSYHKDPVLVGVVSSGNLEVLVEPALLDGACRIEVRTSAMGFRQIWEAVLTDVSDRWPTCAFPSTMPEQHRQSYRCASIKRCRCT